MRSRPVLGGFDSRSPCIPAPSAMYPSPLGFGHGLSRFSPPKDQLKTFGVLYLGSDLETCFLETVIRDRSEAQTRPPPLPINEIEEWDQVAVEVSETLLLVDLSGSGTVRHGIPTDVVRAQSHKLSQLWSLALWSNRTQVAGI